MKTKNEIALDILDQLEEGVKTTFDLSVKIHKCKKDTYEILKKLELKQVVKRDKKTDSKNIYWVLT